MGNKSNKPKNDEDDEKNIKIYIVGDSGVGKTSLIKVATGGIFNPDERVTGVTSFYQKLFSYNNKNYYLNIWDTIGEEKLRSLNRLFFFESKIVIFVYDICYRNNLESLENYWINEINDKLGSSIIKGICGNKSDLYMKREVSEKEGKKLADSIGAKFIETSAKDDPDGLSHFLDELVISYINNLTPLKEVYDNNFNKK